MEHMTSIMMTDIVGFTELTRQEEASVRKVGQKHRNVLQNTASQFHGRIINIFGDSALALFDHPVDAIKCALEIQHEVQADPVIPMRIALHSGEIITEGNEVYGEAINLTSRILKLAIPGSILLSDTISRSQSLPVSITIRSIGVFHLKYVNRPVEIFGMEGPGLVVPECDEKEHEESLLSNSLAVMPFINLGSKGDFDYLGEGFSEAIIHALSKLEGVNVTSRSSSFAFHKLHQDSKEARRVLGVAHVLEGSVQKYGEKIRVTAQLINTETRFHVFSETYDKKIEDLFVIQEEIAWMIAQRLKQEITQQEKIQLVQPKTSSVKALELYLQAKQLMVYPGKEEILRAIEKFKQSIETDPDFVLPYTGISMSYTFLGALRHLEEEVVYQQASKYALRAIQIEPELPEAMVVHALSSFWINDWNLRNGEQIINHALRIAPGSAEIRLFHGMFTLMSGNARDALIELLLANKLDPLNPNILSRLAYTYLCLKNFDEAHTCFRLAHNTAPFAMYISYILSWSYLLQQQYEKAESALKEVDQEKDVYQSTYGTQGFLDARQGRMGKAYEKIQQIGQMMEEDTIRFPHYNYALVYAGLNKTDEMFYHLEKAFAEKPVHLMFFQADPFWEPYRNDSRYIRLVNQVFKRSAKAGRITLHSETRETLNIHSDQILFIAAEDNYSRIVWTEGKNRKEKVLRTTLKHLEDQLAGTEMIRCHRSYMVNWSRYTLRGDSRRYRLTSQFSDEVIPVSRSYSKSLIQRMMS